MGDADSASEQEVSQKEINPEIDFKFHKLIANLPSPLETFQTISEIDLNPEEVELTPLEAKESMNTMSAKAYGYGMYMTDMAILAFENQNQQVLSYFKVCRELARDLGAGDIFDQTITTNFEENTSNSESFVRMMDDAFNAMDEYMVNNERLINATEVFVGSWIESQLIACRMLKGLDVNEKTLPLYKAIFEQKVHASNLMNVLAEIEEEMDERVVSAVEDIMMFYAGFSTPESISQDDLNELEDKLLKLKSLLISGE
ncbi:MAG: hypothetical protein Kow0075_10850 [Salibacteraceae bacterium]